LLFLYTCTKFASSSQPATTDRNILGKNPKTPKILSIPKTSKQACPQPTKQPIQKQLLRSTKINPAKAYLVLPNPILEEENKSPISPATSRAYLIYTQAVDPNPFICTNLPVTPLIGRI
jgi:hypothetical protein